MARISPERGPDSVLALQLQTQMEHSQMIRYEHNLATCYEAEYLLSLKVQEDIYAVNGLCRIPDYSYDEDGFEVMSVNDQSQNQSQMKAATIYRRTSAGDKTVISMPQSSDSMDTSNNSSTEQEILHELNPAMQTGYSQCHIQSHFDARNGYSLPYTPCSVITDHHNQHESHGEGPLRKKHRPDVEMPEY